MLCLTYNLWAKLSIFSTVTWSLEPHWPCLHVVVQTGPKWFSSQDRKSKARPHIFTLIINVSLNWQFCLILTQTPSNQADCKSEVFLGVWVPQPQDIPRDVWHPSDKTVLISMRCHELTPEGKTVCLLLVRTLTEDRIGRLQAWKRLLQLLRGFT